MKIAVIGATGLVGRKMIEILKERKFPYNTLILAASERSAGQNINNTKVVTITEALALEPNIALFSAGGAVSREWAPKFAANGCIVIDNSSYWRMHPDVKLIVPETNGFLLTGEERIIANPNCSTIQMVIALTSLHKELSIKRIVVSTYQSVSGSGQRGINQLEMERAGTEIFNPAYPYPIDKNIIPHIDSFFENGYTGEELKMIDETRKILGKNNMAITATTVRVPVEGAHSESVNVTFEKSFEMNEIFSLLRKSSGVIVQDNPNESLYPMPLYASGRDEVFVGRVRRDFSAENSINLWIVADNLRRGAATNAVMIAQQIYPMCKFS